MQEPLGKVEQEQKDAGPTTGHRRMPEPVDLQVSLELATSFQGIWVTPGYAGVLLAASHPASQFPASIPPPNV